MGGITSRLYSLQISDREKYELLSDKNRIREWKTPPQRGFITDHFNNVLADNDRVFQAHLDLDQIQDFNDIVFKLKNILELSNNELKKICNFHNKKYYSKNLYHNTTKISSKSIKKK